MKQGQVAFCRGLCVMIYASDVILIDVDEAITGMYYNKKDPSFEMIDFMLL
jgi:hypothetical protein